MLKNFMAPLSLFLDHTGEKIKIILKTEDLKIFMEILL